jgi:hypothetical protein
MERASAGSRSRLLEVLAWTAALTAGILVLLPSTVEWIRARDTQKLTRERADQAEAASRQAAQELLWLEQDPAADEKLREAREAEARKRNENHD